MILHENKEADAMEGIKIKILGFAIEVQRMDLITTVAIGVIIAITVIVIVYVKHAGN